MKWHLIMTKPPYHELKLINTRVFKSKGNPNRINSAIETDKLNIKRRCAKFLNFDTASFMD